MKVRMLIAAIVGAFLSGLQAYGMANCGTAASLSSPEVSNCKAQFGLMRYYDKGIESTVALNSQNLILEVHRSQNNKALWYHVGKLNGLAITWGPSQSLGPNGIRPSVALTDDGVVLVVYGNSIGRNGSELNYSVGKLDATGGVDQAIEWKVAGQKWDNGYAPSIAIVGSSIVGVHESNTTSNHKMYYRVGHFDNDYKISWDSAPYGIHYGWGTNPHIAVNAAHQLIEVHQVTNEHLLHYICGIVTSKDIKFSTNQPRYNDNGRTPVVALADSGLAVEIDRVAGEGYPSTMTGRPNPGKLGDMAWTEAEPYETDWRYHPGVPDEYSAIAVSGNTVISTGSDGSDLYSSASMILDRANWMNDMLPSIGSKSLSEITFPGTHDAGMYTSSDLGKFSLAQDQSIYQQLQGGVRYFDLRVRRTSDSSGFRIYHGPDAPILKEWFDGPTTEEVLQDVSKFMKEGHKEVVVLKFSHFRDFNGCKGGIYETLRDSIYDSLGQWIYKDSTHPFQTPLADVTKAGGKVIVVVDKGYALDKQDYAGESCGLPREGFYVYRDWSSGSEDDSTTPAQGQATVFDEYSNTTDLGSMKREQLQLLANFDGKMKYNNRVPCDLFLLSWTLTPSGGVGPASAPANRDLEQVLTLEPNKNDKIPNVLFVDYYERSRVTDIAVKLTQKFVQ
jgi:hypothetical protein